MSQLDRFADGDSIDIVVCWREAKKKKFMNNIGSLLVR